MTTETMPMTSSPPSGYRRLWAGVPREVGYLALTAVLVVVAAGAFSVLSSFSGSSAPELILLALVVLGLLWFGRVFALLEIVRLRWAGMSPTAAAPWRQATSPNRLVRILEVARDPHAWLDLVFTVVVFPIVGFLVSGITGFLLFFGLASTVGGPVLALLGPINGLDGAARGIFDSRVSIGVGLFVLGVIFLAVFPFATHGSVRLQNAIASAMLGRFRSERLAEAVVGLQESRSAAVSAEGTALRRLERDIHDGPQQRLIRMQMDLAAAARAANTDPERSKGLIEEALQQSRDALEELRALSRGFAPPLLLDRGLAAALEAVVDRAAVPTRFTDELPADAALPVELERNAYFIAAELLTNVGKHARATRAELILSASEGADGRELRVVVTDDGTGGAAVRAGHGLAGIEERLRGLGGSVELRSPVGGPTHVRVSIPAPSSPSDEPLSTSDEPLSTSDVPLSTSDVPAMPSDEPSSPTLAYPTEELPRDGAASPDRPRTTP